MKPEQNLLYESPEVEMIAIEIERGFATSAGASGEDGMWNGLN